MLRLTKLPISKKLLVTFQNVRLLCYIQHVLQKNNRLDTRERSYSYDDDDVEGDDDQR